MTAAYVLHALGLVGLGLLASIVGSLAGLGGGFILTPALRLFYHIPPAEASGLSLVLVTANVCSACYAFYKQKRIDFATAVPMGLAAMPFAVLGALLVKYAPALGFDLIYVVLLGAMSIDLFRKRGGVAASRLAGAIPWTVTHRFTDGAGTTYDYLISRPLSLAVGAVAGFASSFLGIGGGVIVVPSLLNLFAMPVHLASATSSTVILFSAPVGVVTHGIRGDVDWAIAPFLIVAGLVGGQIGASIASRLSGRTLTLSIAAILAATAIALALSHLI